jgi:signal transduction histidine kinase
MEEAQTLGCQAVAFGLDTLDMARIHEEAIHKIEEGIAGNGAAANAGLAVKTVKKLARKTETQRERASAFFAEAINPIEETHFTAGETRGRLRRLSESLHQRTVELAASKQRLKQKIIKRKTKEKALRQSGEHQTKLLKDSLQLQQRLQRLTHRLLVAQENERKKISRELRNEIAQTLLGINVRLVSLQVGATASTKGRQDEIASTQQLVAESAKTMHRFTRRFEKVAAVASSKARTPPKRHHER